MSSIASLGSLLPPSPLIRGYLFRIPLQIYNRQKEAEAGTLRQSAVEFFGSGKLARHLGLRPTKALEDFETRDIAHVLTAVEHAIFSRIPTKEFLGQVKLLRKIIT